ncbi:universal stress protein [Sinomonas cellulolyticus]|jgi:nucleotide-binding universal stress UspA family protein|uniref:Universal stress protein n=1 Tax=Sinomonas cellulolyticus TaxID=2801916 RepID=A0ABS1K341_9MICC|nr:MULTISPECIES: universal stress protein [Sinomonas]MBL0705797.1 universal stress protein [Sinomonas cellulolyticus]GHG42071.1 universal stress protein [Sinomonas sp. KCTC 49339]
MTEAQDTSRTPHGIVVGVDGSPLSIEALRWAARMEPTVGGPITAIAAWHIPASAASFAEYPGVDWNPEEDAGTVLRDALAEAFGDEPPAGLVARIVQGRPAQVLLDASRDASMLVVGSRGLGGFMGLLLGSVSRACAEHAACPVMVLHEPGDERAGEEAGAEELAHS